MSTMKGPLLSVENNSFVSWLCERLHLKPQAKSSPAEAHEANVLFLQMKYGLNRAKEAINSCQRFNDVT